MGFRLKRLPVECRYGSALKNTSVEPNPSRERDYCQQTHTRLKEGEPKTEREGARDTDRQTDRHRVREPETERQREPETDRKTDRQTGERDRHRATERGEKCTVCLKGNIIIYDTYKETTKYTH